MNQKILISLGVNLHNAAKTKAANESIYLKDYIVSLIKSDLEFADKHKGYLVLGFEKYILNQTSDVQTTSFDIDERLLSEMTSRISYINGSENNSGDFTINLNDYVASLIICDMPNRATDYDSEAYTIGYEIPLKK